MAEQCRELFCFTHQSVPFRFKTAITSSLSPSLTSILLYIICSNPSQLFLLHPLSIATTSASQVCPEEKTCMRSLLTFLALYLEPIFGHKTN